MTLAWILCALGLVFGAGLGLAGLVFPRWAARLVRLQEAAPGAAAEFRATFGGLFFALHATPLAMLALQAESNDVGLLLMATGASGVIAGGWLATAAGRILSMALDGTNTPFNRASVGVEALIGLMIAAPWIAWALQALRIT